MSDIYDNALDVCTLNTELLPVNSERAPTRKQHNLCEEDIILYYIITNAFFVFLIALSFLERLLSFFRPTGQTFEKQVIF